MAPCVGLPRYPRSLNGRMLEERKECSQGGLGRFFRKKMTAFNSVPLDVGAPGFPDREWPVGLSRNAGATPKNESRACDLFPGRFVGLVCAEVIGRASPVIFASCM